MWKYKRIFFLFNSNKGPYFGTWAFLYENKIFIFFPHTRRFVLCSSFMLLIFSHNISFDKDFKPEIINTMIYLKTINNVGLENLINYISFYLNLKINYMSNNKTWGLSHFDTSLVPLGFRPSVFGHWILK